MPRHRVPLSEKLEAEAAGWVARLDSGPLKDSESQAFEAWRASSPAHNSAFERYDRLWSDLGVAAEQLSAVPTHGSHVAQAANDQTPWLRRAASIGILIAGAGLLGWSALDWQGNSDTKNPTQIAEVENSGPATTDVRLAKTDIGEQQSLTMEDGSRISLNTATSLAIAFSSTSRIIDLEQGEAFFEVAHDPDRPFIVRSSKGSVRAVGTKFTVRLDANGDLIVAVSEGEVLVAKGRENLQEPKVMEQATSLAAGQVLDIASLNRPPVISRLAPEELGKALAWRQGDVVFEGDSLAEAASEFQRYTKRRIVVDPRVANYSVGGYFRTNDLDAFAETVEAVFPVKAIENREELRFVPAD